MSMILILMAAFCPVFGDLCKKVFKNIYYQVVVVLYVLFSSFSVCVFKL
jgi:hypothetical protein